MCNHLSTILALLPTRLYTVTHQHYYALQYSEQWRCGHVAHVCTHQSQCPTPKSVCASIHQNVFMHYDHKRGGGKNLRGEHNLNCWACKLPVYNPKWQYYMALQWVQNIYSTRYSISSKIILALLALFSLPPPPSWHIVFVWLFRSTEQGVLP